MQQNYKRKGIVLAGGTATRLFPITKHISKQLLPVYNKPCVFYPIQTLKNGGITEIALIIKEKDYIFFYDLLGHGEEFGLNIEYIFQREPKGIAEAYILAEEFLSDADSTALILGDNLFLDSTISEKIKNSEIGDNKVFLYRTEDTKRYGVANVDWENKKIIDIEEKPESPKSQFAVTGLYLFDKSAIEKAKTLTPSARGEVEITDISNAFITEGKLSFEVLEQTSARWYDCGTFDSLLEAGLYVGYQENQRGVKWGDLSI